jgi:hypothetical protein
MKRNIKKRRVVGTLSNKEWAQALEQFHRAEVEKWRKDIAEQQQRHQDEKRWVAQDIHYQTVINARHELQAMLEREFPDPALRGVLTAHVGRALAAVYAKFDERQSEQRKA